MKLVPKLSLRPLIRSIRTWRWFPILVTAIVTAALVFANLDGYQNELFGRGDFFGELPTINWTHGWPTICFVRDSSYPLSGVYIEDNQYQRSWTGLSGNFSRWPFDKAPTAVFWIKPFLVDVSFFLVVVLGTAFSSAWLDRKFKRNKSFGLKGMFLLTALSAALCVITIQCLMAGKPQQFVEHAFAASVPLSTKLRYAAQLSAMAVIALGVAITVSVGLHVLLLNWRIWSRSRKFSARQPIPG